MAVRYEGENGGIHPTKHKLQEQVFVYKLWEQIFEFRSFGVVDVFGTD